MNLTEPARQTAIVAHTDVFVAGAGPAGVCAALAAARQGARVRLVDTAGCLGGVWTAGLLCWILDAANKPGIIAELGAQLDARGARRFRESGGSNYAYDPEAMKLLLEELCVAAGVEVQLHTRIVAAARNQDNRLAVAVTESKSGRQAWAAKVFIDATGDGDLAFQSGCTFSIGCPETGRVQPMSMACVLAGLSFEEVEPFVGGADWQNQERLLAEFHRAGIDPSYHPGILVVIHEDLFGLIANHEYNVPCDDAQSITDATLRARAEVNALVEALRSLGGVWRNIRLVATAEQIGVREGRRVHGRAQVDIKDLLSGHLPVDSIATCTFPIDVHSLDPEKTKGFTNGAHGGKKVQAYGLPLRALIARDCDGLLMAGRCISGDFYAHSSYRVTGNAAATGEAAGVCAALSASREELPHAVPWQEVSAALESLRGTSDVVRANCSEAIGDD